MAIEGPIAAVIGELSNFPNGQDMARVLKSITPELGDAHLRVSSDFHRATARVANGKTVAVRVTKAKPATASGVPMLRFKRPTDLQQYELIYFGGLATDGVPVVHKRKPTELGTLKTISLVCSR